MSLVWVEGGPSEAPPEKALQGHHPESEEKKGRERNQKRELHVWMKKELEGSSALGSLELLCGYNSTFYHNKTSKKTKSTRKINNNLKTTGQETSQISPNLGLFKVYVCVCGGFIYLFLGSPHFLLGGFCFPGAETGRRWKRRPSPGPA